MQAFDSHTVKSPLAWSTSLRESTRVSGAPQVVPAALL